jgi:hypothetical protein
MGSCGRISYHTKIGRMLIRNIVRGLAAALSHQSYDTIAFELCAGLLWEARKDLVHP